jgi:hypothetical protein
MGLVLPRFDRSSSLGPSVTVPFGERQAGLTKLRLKLLILVLLTTLGRAGPAEASGVTPMALEEVVGNAELIIEGKIVSSAPTSRAGELGTYRVLVQRVLAGHQKASELTVTYLNPGSPHYSVSMTGSGLEDRLEEGKVYILLFAPEARRLLNERRLLRAEVFERKDDVLLAWKERHVSSNEPIPVELEGKLTFEQGQGYRIEGKDVRIHLRVSENKVLVQNLQDLEGKYVKVQGFLETYFSNGTGNCEQLGISEGFSIEKVREK